MMSNIFDTRDPPGVDDRAYGNRPRGSGRLPLSLKVVLANLLGNDDGRLDTPDQITAFGGWNGSPDECLSQNAGDGTRGWIPRGSLALPR